MVEIGMQSMKARLLLARNINAILRARHEDQSGLARWCRKKPSWINKILAGKRPMHIDDFDRVADYLGLSVYQLFQPGVSALTERRKTSDRRGGRERRIGHGERTIVVADQQPQGRPHEAAGPRSATTEIHAITRDFADKITAVLAQEKPRGQTARARGKKPRPRNVHRNSSGPDIEKAG